MRTSCQRVEITTRQIAEDGLKIMTAGNVTEVEKMRSAWEQMQIKESYPSPGADIDRYLSVIEAKQGKARPYVILAVHRGSPSAMLIGRIERHCVNIKLGYKALISPALKCLVVVYGGFIGDSEFYFPLVSEVLDLLRSGRIDAVFFNHLRTDSVMYQLVRQTPPLWIRDYFPKIEPHWIMDIPKSMNLFYQGLSPRHRKHLRYYVNRLEKAYPGNITMRKYTTKEDSEYTVKAASEISRRTYKCALDCRIVDNSETRELLLSAARHGWLRAYVLYVNEKPLAFRFALKYGKTCFADGTGYDPEWKNFRIGTALFLKVIEDICRDPSVDYYDFGFGDAEYKQSYGTDYWQEASVYIFAPRLYPVFINLVQSSVAAVSCGMEKILTKTGLIEHIKRCWRSLLEKRAKKTATELGG
jgi:hypothetical protein